MLYGGKKKKLVKNEDVPQRWRRDWKGKWGEEGRGGGGWELSGRASMKPEPPEGGNVGWRAKTFRTRRCHGVTCPGTQTYKPQSTQQEIPGSPR